jgi:hypothetical protein
MEATLAMASLGRFNPDEPHFKVVMKYERFARYIDLFAGKKIFPEFCFMKSLEWKIKREFQLGGCCRASASYGILRYFMKREADFVGSFPGKPESQIELRSVR